MLRFNNSRLFGSSKRLLALFLSVLSFGGTVTHGSDNRGCNISNNSGNQNEECIVGISMNNPGIGDLISRIGHLQNINKEELVQIFETDFLPIIFRDFANITRFRVVNVHRERLSNMILCYWDISPAYATHLINLLWMGSLLICLNEGPAEMVRMMNDFRNWNRNNIGIYDLYYYFVEKTKQQ